MGLKARARVGAGGTLRQKLDGAAAGQSPGGSQWGAVAALRATRTPSRRPGLWPHVSERGPAGRAERCPGEGLTDHHDVELEALLHGLPAHLLQDGVDAHVAKVHGGLLVPGRRCRLEAGVSGGVSHVASAAGSCLGGCGKKGRGVRGDPTSSGRNNHRLRSQTGKRRLSCPEALVTEPYKRHPLLAAMQVAWPAGRHPDPQTCLTSDSSPPACPAHLLIT